PGTVALRRKNQPLGFATWHTFTKQVRSARKRQRLGTGCECRIDLRHPIDSASPLGKKQARIRPISKPSIVGDSNICASIPGSKRLQRGVEGDDGAVAVTGVDVSASWMDQQLIANVIPCRRGERPKCGEVPADTVKFYGGIVG